MYYEHVSNEPATVAHYGADIGSDVPALGGFSLEFLNSDHHVHSLKVGGMSSGRDSRDYLLGFSDADHGISGRDGDPVRMTAKYFRPGAMPTLTVAGRADGRGSTLARLPRLAAHELFVLRGFEISAVGDNHNIRMIGIRYIRWRDAVSVTFADDSPDDDAFTFAIHYFVMPHASHTGRRRNPHFLGPFPQRFRFTESARIAKTNPGVAMLSGFTFRFTDSDHHLRKIAIDLEPTDAIDVTFTDDERDNPVDAFVEYVLALPYIR